MFPKPVEPVYWFTRETMPANTGAEAEVPPLLLWPIPQKRPQKPQLPWLQNQ